nr:U3 snoRNP protein [Polyrhizophydium stewartii]
MDDARVKGLNTSGGANRFKFQSFNDRIQSIRIDAIHRVIKSHEASEDVESFFQDAIARTAELNCTIHYTLFLRDLRPFSGSLLQILFHKQDIASVIERHLAVPNSQGTTTILEVVVALAKDLQEEFYPHFPAIFQAIVSLVQPATHPELLEAVFNCLAYLFKCLSKQLLGDIENTFALLLPVLRHSKLYVRKFAAESFGFLVRKIRDTDRQREVFRFMMACLFDNQTCEFAESISLTLFETIKKVMILMGHYGSRDSLSDLWTPVLEVALAAANAAKQDATPLRFAELSHCLDFSALFGLAEKAAPAVLVEIPAAKQARAEWARLLCSIMLRAPMDDALVRGKSLMESLCCFSDFELALVLFHNLQAVGYVHFARFIVPYALGTVQRVWSIDPDRCTLFLADVFGAGFDNILHQVPHNLKDQHGMIRFAETDIFSTRAGRASAVPPPMFTKDIGLAILDRIESLSKPTKSAASIDAHAGTIFSALLVISRLSLPEARLSGVLRSLVKIALKQAGQDTLTLAPASKLEGSAAEVLRSIAGAALSTLSTRLSKLKNGLADMWDLVVKMALPAAGSNRALLAGIADYVEALAQDPFESKDSHLTADALTSVAAILLPSVGSLIGPVRLHTLRILAAFAQPHMRPIKDSPLHGPCPLFRLCLDIERTPRSVATAREMTILLRRIDSHVESKAMPALYDGVVMRYLCALLSVNFSPLWPEVTKSLVIAAKTNIPEFWAIFLEVFSLVRSNEPHEPGQPAYNMRIELDPGTGVSDHGASVGDGRGDGDDDDGDEDGDGDDAAARGIDSSTGAKAGKLRAAGTAKGAASRGSARVSFECTTLNEFYASWALSVRRLRQTHASCLAIFIEATQPDLERIDTVNIYCLLIRTLAELPGVVDRYSKDIVPVFLAIFHAEFDAAAPETPAGKAMDAALAVTAQEQTGTRHARTKILAFLDVFAKLNSPSRLHGAAELYSVLSQLLAKGDAKIQQRSLDCVIAWNEPGVAAYAEHLRNLAQDDKFRDHLTTLDIHDLRSRVKRQDLPAIMKVVVRILYGKLVSRRGRSASKTGVRARRVAIFAFLAGLDVHERQYMVDLMLEPFQGILEQPGPGSGHALAEFAINTDLPASALGPIKKQIGFLTVLEDFIKQLRSLVAPYLPSVLKTVLYLLHFSEDATRKALVRTGQETDILMADDNGADDVDADATAGADAEDDAEIAASDAGVSNAGISQIRAVRTGALRRLTQLFSIAVEFDFAPYIPALFSSFVSYRVPRLAIENTQAPSALVEMVVAWSKSLAYLPFLVTQNAQLLPAVLSLLSAKKVHDKVVLVVIEMIESIQELHAAHPDSNVMQSTLLPHMTLLLSQLERALAQHLEGVGQRARLAGDGITMRIIRVLSGLSSFVTAADNAETLVAILLPLLRRPNRSVPEATKVDLLEIFGHFVPMLPPLRTGRIDRSPHFNVVCSLFATLSTRVARVKLLFVFRQLAQFDVDALVPVADLLDDMNAFSARRMDEPDFDRRFGAFSRINESLYLSLTPAQWRPILGNLVFFTQEQDEYAIRTSAAYGVQRFIVRTGELFDGGSASQGTAAAMGDSNKPANAAIAPREPTHMDLALQFVLPSIKIGIRHSAMPVRAEFTTMLGLLVQTFPSLQQFQDMVVLLAEGDDEASFFSNIFHLQVHRRQRALRRLSEICDKGCLRSNNVVNIFVPLVSHFIFESDRVQDHAIINDAIGALGSCAGALSWSHYFSLAKRFLNLIPRRPELERILVRSLVHILDRFHFDLNGEDELAAQALKEAVPMDVDGARSMAIGSPDATAEDKVIRDDDDEDEDDDDDDNNSDNGNGQAEDQTMPGTKAPESNGSRPDRTRDVASVPRAAARPEAVAADASDMLVDTPVLNGADVTRAGEVPAQPRSQSRRILDTVVNRLLPGLHRLIAVKDDELVPVRIPLAIPVTKMLKLFPPSAMDLHLPKLLLSLCNIMKSHLQSTRDATRDTLAKISVMLGPAYLSYVVKELCSALTRGYQLHVLGYTLHAVVAALVPTIEPGSIDASVKMIMGVAVQDIFGETGKEREVDELRGKMREIKTSKSFDTLELTARVVSLGKIGVLLLPLKEIMLETANVKTIRQIEEIFRRIAVGLNANAGVSMVDFMKFVHSLVTENMALVQPDKTDKAKQSNAERTFLVQMKRTDTAEPLRYFQANAHLFVEFGLSLLLAALRRERIDLRDKEHLQMLDPLVDAMGTSLYSKHAAITVLALRVIALLLRAPLPSLQDARPVYVKRVFQLIAKSTSTASELVQACFRVLTIILRDCPDVPVTEKQIVTLAAIVQPDLEVPDRQTTTFTLIRAILGRKYVAKEVYDLMDVIVRLLVTSQSSQVRELARQAYMQFLLDYPHGHLRFRKQMTYMIKNLEYEHESGRSSILEVLNTAIAKFSDEILAEYAQILFAALVLSMVNDLSATCRKMAGMLVCALLKRLDVGGAEKLIGLTERWFAHKELRMRRTAAQAFGLVLQAFGDRAAKWVQAFMPHLEASLVSVVGELHERMEANADELGVDTADAAQGEDGDAPHGLKQWELGYYSLNTLTQIVSVLPGVVVVEPRAWASRPDDEDDDNEESGAGEDSGGARVCIWERVSQLLVHPHQWIRSQAAKLVGLVFSRIDPETRCPRGAAGAGKPHPLVATDADIRRIAGRCCSQLDSDLTTDDLAKQAVKNLVYLGRCLASRLETEAAPSQDGASDSDDPDVDNNNGAEADDVLGEGTDGEAQPQQRSTLLWLTHRLAYLARVETGKRRGPVLRRSVFQWFAAISPSIPKAARRPYYLSMVGALYRVAKDETAKGPVADELKQLALEVMAMFETQLGKAEYLDIYTKVHQQVLAVRQERRVQRSILAVADPAASAKRRTQKNLAKRNSRKRRADEFSSRRIRTGHSKKARGLNLD